MPPSPIPAPLPPWARTLLQVAPFIQAGLQEVLQYIHAINAVDQAPAAEWRHLQIVWERVGNAEAADRYVNSFDIVNITNGNVDSTWTDTDYNTVQTQVVGMIAAFQALQASGMRCKEVRYYRRQFNPVTFTDPFAPSGPPDRIFQVGTVGTGTGASTTAQVAITHTEKTPYPRHWGRSYWPVPAAGVIGTDGYIVSSLIDTFAAQLGSHMQTLQAAEFFPVVPVTQIQKAPARALLQVNSIQVDNVADVIRRRRPSVTTHRAFAP